MPELEVDTQIKIKAIAERNDMSIADCMRWLLERAIRENNGSLND